MKTLALLVGLALLGPATAQVVPDEFPDPSEPFADRAQREWVERHRPFLSGLFASSSVAAGPEVGQPEVIAALAFDAGYRFASGHALAVTTSMRGPLERNPLTGARDEGLTAVIGAEAVLALGGRADRASVLRGAELGLGAGVALFDAASGDARTLALPSVSVRPRVAIPLTPTLALPVGIQVTKEVGEDARPLFVGLSLGVRRIWADEARMVLE